MTANRISSNGQYQFSVNLMLAKQQQLAQTYQQISTGEKIVHGADDPIGSARAVQLDRTVDRLDQYDDNTETLRSRLNQQESVLEQANDTLTRVRTLTVQANNATLSDEDRVSIASEISSLRDQLLALANTDDGTGHYLFGGSRDSNVPFTLDGDSVIYNGDQNQRRVEVTSGLQVADTVPGSEVFMRLRTGDGSADAQAGSANQGTGVLLDFAVTDSTTWNHSSYQVVFTAEDSYQVQASDGSVLASGDYHEGDSIDYGGIQLRIEGQPAVGDQFAIGPSGTRDIFATLDTLVTALEQKVTTPQQMAARQNALQSSLRDVSVAQQRFIDVRAEGGAGQAALDDANSLNEARSVTTKTDLSAIRDLDYAEALSRYSQEKVALEAAQKVFAQIQKMSLFDQI